MGGSASEPHSVTDPDALIAIARRAAAAGAKAIISREGSAGSVRFKSSETDPVSESDEAAEIAIRAVIEAERPLDAIVGEEGEAVSGSSGLRWVIDPLDGTVNYLYGIPQWCVSVAVEDGNGPLVGVVLDPSRNEEFSAVRGQPAMLNGTPIAVRGAHQPAGDPLDGVLLATGFNYEAPVRALQGEVFVDLIERVRDIRRGGSAALDLCWAAIGRVDAYLEHGVRVWDVSAAGLVCRSAGLETKTLPSRDGWPAGLVAAPAGLCAPLAAAFGYEVEPPEWPSTPIY